MRKWALALSGAALIALLAGTALAQEAGEPVLDTPEPSAFLTLDLQAGFALDPFFVSVNGGGDLDASELDPACTGFINTDPILSANWEGEADLLRLFFYSDHDPTLVVQLPDGSYLCNDDANSLLLDPVVRIEDPQPGAYRVWVGSFDAGQLLPGVLVITAREDLTLGSFNLGRLIRREAVAEEPVAAEEVLPELGELRQRVQGALALGARRAGVVVEAGAAPITATATVTGVLPAFALPTAEGSPVPVCNGLITARPQLLFSMAEGAQSLSVMFEAAGAEPVDTTLVVIGPDAQVFCADDSAQGSNLNPLLTLENPAPGAYAVLVGRVGAAGEITGTVTAAADAMLEPALMTTEPSGE